MDFSQLIPKQYVDHLKENKKLIIIARPFDTSKEVLSLAFDLHHIYETRPLPTGVSWVRDAPMDDIPEGRTAEQIIDSFYQTLARMSRSVGGAQIDLILANPSEVINN